MLVRNLQTSSHTVCSYVKIRNSGMIMMIMGSEIFIQWLGILINSACSSIRRMSVPDATSSDSINPISLSSPSSGNVLVLLNTLYTSGFALHSPNLPLLSGSFCICAYEKQNISRKHVAILPHPLEIIFSNFCNYIFEFIFKKFLLIEMVL